MPLISEPTNINLYFGQRNQVTLEKFDHLSEKLRRSRTGTLDFLITHYEWFEKHKKEVIGWPPQNPSLFLQWLMRCCSNSPTETGRDQTTIYTSWSRGNMTGRNNTANLTNLPLSMHNNASLRYSPKSHGCLSKSILTTSCYGCIVTMWTHESSWNQDLDMNILELWAM